MGIRCAVQALHFANTEKTPVVPRPTCRKWPRSSTSVVPSEMKCSEVPIDGFWTDKTGESWRRCTVMVMMFQGLSHAALDLMWHHTGRPKDELRRWVMQFSRVKIDFVLHMQIYVPQWCKKHSWFARVPFTTQNATPAKHRKTSKQHHRTNISIIFPTQPSLSRGCVFSF